MAAITPVWAVRKSGVDYVMEADNQSLIYRPNNPSEATLTFDNSDKSLMSVFSEEDEVTMKIGSTVMMDAYIDKITDVYHPNKKIDLVLHLTDWGSYLAAKRAFEKNYYKTIVVSQLFADAANALSPGMPTNITGLTTSAANIKKDFVGTYVKNAWDEGAQNAGADFFVDETKTLQAWPFGGRDLVEPSSGHRYSIIDSTPVSIWQLRARFDYDITFIRDVSNKYRSVIQTSGVDETFPVGIDDAVTIQAWNPGSNAMYSAFFDPLGPISGFASGKFPYKFVAAQNVGGATFPTIQLIYPQTGGSVEPAFIGRSYDNLGNEIFQNMAINAGDWQTWRFIMKNALTGTAVTKIEVRFITRSTGAYYSRDIYPDLINQSGARNDFVFMEYSMPPGPGWTQVGSPTTIDLILFIFTPLSGYTPDSYIEFSKFYFYRKQRQSVSIAGTPATQKIIVDASITNPATMLNYVTAELARVQNTVKQPDFTIDGNVNLRMPGYNIDVDFTNIFNSTRTGTQLRIGEIRHLLKAGIHYTEIYLDTSYNRK